MFGSLDQFGWLRIHLCISGFAYHRIFQRSIFYFILLWHSTKIVYAIAWVMARSMKLSGPESLAAAANIFIGQTEAPLIIKPYIKKI